MAEYTWPLKKMPPEDLDRNQRSIEAVRSWAERMGIWLTVDDISIIVSEAVTAWEPIDVHEVTRDLSQATDRMRKFGGVVML